MNKEVKETIKILQNNSLVKSGSYEFIGDSDITYAEIYILLKFIEDLQNEAEEQCKKQKGIIDKAINNSQYWIDYYTRLNSDERIALRLQENIDILKEVE